MTTGGENKGGEGRGLPVGFAWRPEGKKWMILVREGAHGEVAQARNDGRWLALKEKDSRVIATDIAKPSGEMDAWAAAQAAAEAALWRCDGYGTGEARGRFVAHGQGFGLPGRWRLKAARAVPGGHEVDAVREGVEVDAVRAAVSSSSGEHDDDCAYYFSDAADAESLCDCGRGAGSAVGALLPTDPKCDACVTCSCPGSCAVDEDGLCVSCGGVSSEIAERFGTPHPVTECKTGKGEPAPREPSALALPCQGCGEAIPEGAPFAERVEDGCPFCAQCAAENASGADPDEMRRGTWPDAARPAPADGAELARLLPGLPRAILAVQNEDDGEEHYQDRREVARACELLLAERERVVALREVDGHEVRAWIANAVAEQGRADEAERKLAEVAALQRTTAADLDAARAQLRIVSAGREDVWHWQGDGRDDPASLVCPVVMSAETLREFVAARERAEAAWRHVDRAMADGNAARAGWTKTGKDLEAARARIAELEAQVARSREQDRPILAGLRALEEQLEPLSLDGESAEATLARLLATPPPGTVAALLADVKAKANEADDNARRLSPRSGEHAMYRDGLLTAASLIRATLGTPSPLDGVVGEVVARDVSRVVDAEPGTYFMTIADLANSEGQMSDRDRNLEIAAVAIRSVAACDAAAKGGA